jgi:hypothetical protein
MKTGKVILWALVSTGALFWLAQPASAQVYVDHSCSRPNAAGSYGYYGDGGYAPSYDYGLYGNAPQPYAYGQDRPYESQDGYAPYSEYGYSNQYGNSRGYGHPYAYDQYGAYPYGYSGRRHSDGFNRYATPYGIHEDHVRRRLSLFPFPHIERRVVHHTHPY